VRSLIAFFEEVPNVGWSHQGQEFTFLILKLLFFLFFLALALLLFTVIKVCLYDLFNLFEILSLKSLQHNEIFDILNYVGVNMT
jgi:hypothetical protein